MKVVLQRVKSAIVKVDNKTVGEIAGGLLLFLGITHNDTQSEVDYLVDKIIKMRIFGDESADEIPTKVGNGKMNKSVVDVGGSVLVVSQFTLYADCKKGNRPSFVNAGRPELAKDLYNYFVQRIKESGLKIESGEFGAHMEVSLTNDGPVTLIIDSYFLFSIDSVF